MRLTREVYVERPGHQEARLLSRGRQRTGPGPNSGIPTRVATLYVVVLTGTYKVPLAHAGWWQGHSVILEGPTNTE